MARRRPGAGAPVAAARMDGEAVGDAPLAMVARDALPGGSTTVGTPVAAGEH